MEKANSCQSVRGHSKISRHQPAGACRIIDNRSQRNIVHSLVPEYKDPKIVSITCTKTLPCPPAMGAAGYPTLKSCLKAWSRPRPRPELK